MCAVVFVPYCNLRCPYCHNHRLVLQADTLDTLPLESVLDRVTSRKDWIDGICVTGGEPTIHRGLPGMLEKMHDAGLQVKIDTNGTQPEILRHLLFHRLVDHVAMDVKAPLDDNAYARCAGVYVPTSLIRASIQAIMASGIPCAFRCTVVPTLLSADEIRQLAGQIKALAFECNPTARPILTLQNFNPADPMDPALKEVKPYDEEVLGRTQTEVNAILG